MLKRGFDVSRATVSVTCQHAVIPPPRPGAPSCGTRHLGSVRSVLAKQVAYQISIFALVRGWIARVVPRIAKVRDGFRCGLIEPSLTLHRLRPYRSSNRTAWGDPRIGCIPGPRPPTALGRGDNWTMAGRRLSPYRSRASPTRKLPAFTNFARRTPIARASGPQFLQRDWAARLPRTTRSKS